MCGFLLYYRHIECLLLEGSFQDILLLYLLLICMFLFTRSAMSMVGLFLIALGTGGIKPCVSAFGGDQFSEHQVRALSPFCISIYWPYSSLMLGGDIGIVRVIATLSSNTCIVALASHPLCFLYTFHCTPSKCGQKFPEIPGTTYCFKGPLFPSLSAPNSL